MLCCCGDMDSIQHCPISSSLHEAQMGLQMTGQIPSPSYLFEDMGEPTKLPLQGDAHTSGMGDLAESSTGREHSGKPADGMCLPCKVCGDKSSGFHYGVMACEGCKGFFRRSIQKRIEYKCHFAGSCPIERVNRNRCQHCRFKKCLAVGMSKESVRIGRYSKRIKQSNMDEIRKLNSRPETSEEREARERREMEMYTMSQTILQAKEVTCQYNIDSIKNLLSKQVEILAHLQAGEESTIPESYTSDLTEEQKNNPKIVAWKVFLEAISPCIRRVVEFAKCLPGFMKIPQIDQMQLLKQAHFEVWMIQISKVASSADRSLMLSDDMLFNSRLVSDMNQSNLWRHIFEFTSSLNDLKLNDMELALFMAVTIMSSDRAGLRQKTDIEPLSEILLECLRREFSRREPQDTKRFFKLVMKMQLLRSTSMLQMESLLGFRLENPSVPVPPLLVELNDASGEPSRLEEEEPNGNKLKKRPRDIWEQLPLTKLTRGAGLFQPPKSVSGIPTNLNRVTAKDETKTLLSCTTSDILSEKL